MKTAISIPSHLFREAERVARRQKKSRSQLYSEALSEYVARHSPEPVTEQMNAVVERIGDKADPFVTTAAWRALERSEW